MNPRSLPMVGVLVLLMLAGAFIFQGPIVTTINEATQIDASQHVSNLPCGPRQYVQSCPGELVCAGGPAGGGQSVFNAERVGVEGRTPYYCVTPVFERRYCGLLKAATGEFQDGGRPANVPACSESYHLSGLVRALGAPSEFIDRIIDTDARGARWIHAQGLELLEDDPDSTEIPIEGYFQCDKADAELEIEYSDDRSAASFTVTNIGNIMLPNMTLVILREGDISERTLSSLGPGERLHRTIAVNGSVGAAIRLSYCNDWEIDHYLEEE